MGPLCLWQFFTFLPFRENSGSANSVLNSCSFRAQTRFLKTSNGETRLQNGEIHPKISKNPGAIWKGQKGSLFCVFSKLKQVRSQHKCTTEAQYVKVSPS